MYTEDQITEKLNTARPTLSQTDRDALFANIAKETTAQAVVVSPYFTFFATKKWLAPVALVLILVMSTGGVVAVAEAAKPGDPLFAVDQTVENIRLALASEDTKVRLEAEFAAERLLELSASLEESLASSRTQNNDDKDSGKNDKARVNETLGFTISYLARTELSSSTKGGLYDELAELLEGARVQIDDKKLRTYDTDSRIEIRNDNDDRRIEIRDGENRLRIREKDGELRIERKDKDDKDEDADEDESEEKEESDDDDNDDYRITPYPTHLKAELEIKVDDDEEDRDSDDKDDSKNESDRDQREPENNDEEEPDEEEESDNDERLEIEVETDLKLEIND